MDIGLRPLDLIEEVFLLFDELRYGWVFVCLGLGTPSNPSFLLFLVSTYEDSELTLLNGNTGNKTRNLAEANAFKSTETNGKRSLEEIYQMIKNCD